MFYEIFSRIKYFILWCVPVRWWDDRSGWWRARRPWAGRRIWTAAWPSERWHLASLHGPASVSGKSCLSQSPATAGCPGESRAPSPRESGAGSAYVITKYLDQYTTSMTFTRVVQKVTLVLESGFIQGFQTNFPGQNLPKIYKYTMEP